MNNKTVVYGVDVSKATLVIGQYESEALSEIANSLESIAAWLASIPTGSKVAMEATGTHHQLLAHLAHAAGMVVHVLNPQTLKHYARAIAQRGKTDRCDARMIARYVVHEQAKLRCWQPPAAPADALSRLIVRRQALVRARQMALPESVGHACPQSAAANPAGELQAHDRWRGSAHLHRTGTRA